MSNLSSVLRRLRGVVVRRCDGGLDDAQLLQRFAGLRDEAAFEVLVWRHGPMVLGVGRRVLYNLDDAEDVLQATFLALARQAPSIVRGQALAGWLYRVAYRTALRARRQRTERLAGQASLDSVPAPPPADEPWRDVWPLLDEELQRLPDKYRIPLVLSYLQGLTNREVAEQLDCPLGTVFTRLARGRELLRRRLSRRGVTLPAGLVATALGAAATAPLRAALVQTTVRAAVLFASAAEAAAGVLSPKVLALTEGALQMLGTSRVRVVWAALVLLAVAGPGAALLAWGVTGREREKAPPPRREAAQPAEAAQRVPKEALRYGGKTFDAWLDVLLTDLKPETRVEAIRALSAFGANGYGREATTAIVEALHGYDVDTPDGDDRKVVDAGVQGIGKIGAEAVPVLVDELKHRPNANRVFVLGCLNQIGRPARAAMPEVTAALRDKDQAVRRAAIWALGSIDREGDSVAAVTAAVTDDDPDVRARAIGLLGEWGKNAREAAPQLLKAALDDPNANCRVQALDALRSLQPRADVIVPGLKKLLKEKDAPVRQRAIALLGGLGKGARDAVPDLAVALQHDPNQGLRLEIADALGSIGPAAKEAIPALTEVVNSYPQSELSARAAKALLKINR
jgi:RNA polymerase sigma factor (sigma-70 family)